MMYTPRKPERKSLRLCLTLSNPFLGGSTCNFRLYGEKHVRKQRKLPNLYCNGVDVSHLYVNNNIDCFGEHAMTCHNIGKISILRIVISKNEVGKIATLSKLLLNRN